MKKSLIIISTILALGVISCNNNSKNTVEKPDEVSEIIDSQKPETLENEINFRQSSCYKYESSKDTVMMKMKRAEVDDEVTGTLSYNYQEQSPSKGTFKGKIVGDTIFADYTFDLHGTTSIRELIFIKKDSSLVEGFGETEKIKGKTKFKPDAIMSFNEATSLEQIPCTED